MTTAYWPHCICVGATDMDSIGLLLMALLSLNSGSGNAADDTVAASARSTRTQCVIAARSDVNRANQALQGCTSVPTNRSKLARIAAEQPPVRQVANSPSRAGNSARASMRGNERVALEAAVPPAGPQAATTVR